MTRFLLLATAGMVTAVTALAGPAPVPYAGCVVNVGHCGSGGDCIVNYGTCDDGGRCVVSIGHCGDGDTSLVAL
jgi:hypothetical protein